MAWAIPLTVHGLYRAYSRMPATSAARVADYLNTQTPSDALIDAGKLSCFSF